MPTRMPFGKFKGDDLEDIYTGYLRWLRDRPNLDARLANAVRRELHARDADEPPGYRHADTARAEPQLPDLHAIVSR